MPQSGPGRQSVRRNSKRRKTNIKRDASRAGSPTPSRAAEMQQQQQQQHQQHQQHAALLTRRLSAVPADLLAEGGGIAAIDDNTYAMTQMRDQIDDYYYGKFYGGLC